MLGMAIGITAVCRFVAIQFELIECSRAGYTPRLGLSRSPC